MIKVPVLIIGGGPAGLTVALALGQKGRRVMLVEQSPGLVTDLPPEVAPFPLGSIRADSHVDLRLGWRLFGFERFDKSVTAHIMEVDGERQLQVQTAFMVGCDGSDSRVRNFLDMDPEEHVPGSVVAVGGRGRVLLAGGAAHPLTANGRSSLTAAISDGLRLAEDLAARLD